MVVIEENTENVNTQNVVSQVQAGIQGNGKGAVLKKGLDGGKKLAGEVERRTGGLKLVKQSRGKLVKSNAPTRGLVFGPLRGETGGISSGKRLRVEHERVGRASGAYTAGMDGIRGTRSQVQGSVEMQAPTSELIVADSTGMDLILQENRSDRKGVNGDK